MAPGNLKRPKKKGNDNLRQIGLLGTIPFLIGVGPMIGYFLGDWLDNKFGTSPFLLIIFIGLGIAAAVKETIKIIKQANRDQEE